MGWIYRIAMKITFFYFNFYFNFYCLSLTNEGGGIDDSGRSGLCIRYCIEYSHCHALTCEMRASDPCSLSAERSILIPEHRLLVP